jgi:4-hydroxy-3-polyprenylbenzoate decarboxylase
MTGNHVALGLTGASGSAYGLRLLQCLLQRDVTVSLMVSKAAAMVLATEVDLALPNSSLATEALLRERLGVNSGVLKVYAKEQWTAPLASGSNAPRAMVVCPCSSGTLSAIAHGASNNLLERAADVVLKERRQLILVVRETPLSVIHLENMLTLARLGVTILPANPGFYHRPRTVDQLVDFVVARVLDHLGVDNDLVTRWGDTSATD